MAAGALAARWKAPGRTSGRPAMRNAAATMIAAPSAMNTQRTTAQARVGLTLRPPSETIVAPMPRASGGPVRPEITDTSTRSITMPSTRCQCAARGRPASAGSTRATSSLNTAAARFAFGAGGIAGDDSGLSPLDGAGGSGSLIAPQRAAPRPPGQAATRSGAAAPLEQQRLSAPKLRESPPAGARGITNISSTDRSIPRRRRPITGV